MSGIVILPNPESSPKNKMEGSDSANLTLRCRAVRWASHSRSVKRCALELAPQIYAPMVPAFIILGTRPQIDSASLYRPATSGPTAATRTAAARSTTAAAAETAAAAKTAATQTAAAETAAAPTVHIRRDRRRWLPVRSLAVALDRARQSIAVYRNSPVANIARPRVDDVSSGVHCLSIALP